MSLCADAFIVKIQNSVEPLYEQGNFNDQKFIMADKNLFHRFAEFTGDRWKKLQNEHRDYLNVNSGSFFVDNMIEIPTLKTLKKLEKIYFGQTVKMPVKLYDFSDVLSVQNLKENEVTIFISEDFVYAIKNEILKEGEDYSLDDLLSLIETPDLKINEDYFLISNNKSKIKQDVFEADFYYFRLKEKKNNKDLNYEDLRAFFDNDDIHLFENKIGHLGTSGSADLLLVDQQELDMYKTIPDCYDEHGRYAKDWHLHEGKNAVLICLSY